MLEEGAIEFLEYETTESYAKLEGPGYKQFITKLTVYIGREANNISPESPEEQLVFIGDSQKISRKHAKIYWNSNRGEWEIKNLSKNKVIVNGAALRKDDTPAKLPPCAAIKVDKYKFYFFPAIKE
jgi:pSer/pThr/pTyr-binding forkhead associated (FHA) protein